MGFNSVSTGLEANHTYTEAAETIAVGDPLSVRADGKASVADLSNGVLAINRANASFDSRGSSQDDSNNWQIGLSNHYGSFLRGVLSDGSAVVIHTGDESITSNGVTAARFSKGGGKLGIVSVDTSASCTPYDLIVLPNDDVVLVYVTSTNLKFVVCDMSAYTSGTIYTVDSGAATLGEGVTRGIRLSNGNLMFIWKDSAANTIEYTVRSTTNSVVVATTTLATLFSTPSYCYTTTEALSDGSRIFYAKYASGELKPAVYKISADGTTVSSGVTLSDTGNVNSYVGRWCGGQIAYRFSNGKYGILAASTNTSSDVGVRFYVIDSTFTTVEHSAALPTSYASTDVTTAFHNDKMYLLEAIGTTIHVCEMDSTGYLGLKTLATGATYAGTALFFNKSSDGDFGVLTTVSQATSQYEVYVTHVKLDFSGFIGSGTQLYFSTSGTASLISSILPFPTSIDPAQPYYLVYHYSSNQRMRGIAYDFNIAAFLGVAASAATAGDPVKVLVSGSVDTAGNASTQELFDNTASDVKGSKGNMVGSVLTLEGTA